MSAPSGEAHGITDRAGGAGGEPDSDREQTRLFYRLSGVLFIGGGLAAIPPDLLHVPHHPASIFLLPLLAIVSGIVSWLIAGWAPRWGLHLIAVVATLEVALTVAAADRVFAVYYVFVAIFVSYVFSDRRAIAAHMAFVIVAALAPIAYDSEDARTLTIAALVLIPTLVIACCMVVYLREQLSASEDRYRRLSECDPLTGIGNYRMLVNRVPRELRRHGRYGHPLALIVIDLDDFKRVNDALGHQRGDLLLREVAAGLSDAVRLHDTVVRQGGDEFAVIAPETDPVAARLLAERLRSRVAATDAGAYPIGASVGCAHFPEDADSFEALLRIADERLRVAKNDGIPRHPRRAPVQSPLKGRRPIRGPGAGGWPD